MKTVKIWNDSEIDQLRSAYSVWPPDLNALSISLGRSRSAIKMKANEMGLSKGNHLTHEEKDFISKNVSILGISATARNIKRSKNTICRFVKENNLNVKVGAHNKWTPTESDIEMIKSSSWSMMKELSEKIGRSIPLIRREMRIMGIVKPIVVKIPTVKKERKPRVYIPKPPRVKKEPKPRIVKVKEIQAPRNLDGENRIREAMARLGLNK